MEAVESKFDRKIDLLNSAHEAALLAIQTSLPGDDSDLTDLSEEASEEEEEVLLEADDTVASILPVVEISPLVRNTRPYPLVEATPSGKHAKVVGSRASMASTAAIVISSSEPEESYDIEDAGEDSDEDFIAPVQGSKAERSSRKFSTTSKAKDSPVAVDDSDESFQAPAQQAKTTKKGGAGKRNASSSSSTSSLGARYRPTTTYPEATYPEADEDADDSMAIELVQKPLKKKSVIYIY